MKTLATNWVQRLAQRRTGDWALKAMGKVEEQGTFGTLGKEMFGINAPKMIRVRGWDEFLDSTTSELGNTAGYFGAGFGLDKLIGGLFKKLADKDAFILGKSIVLNLVPASILYAMPFFRNYITAKHTGSTRFLDIIGAKTLAPPQSKEEFDQKERYYLRTGASIVGGATLLSLAGLTRGVVRARKGLAFASKGLTQKAAQWFGKHFTFQNGDFRRMSTATGLWFWGLPAYAGWMHAARDKSERVEVLIKTINFFAMFYFLDVGIQKLLGTSKTYNKELIQQLQAMANKAAHTASKGEKSTGKISFTKANLTNAMDKLGYNATKQKKYLKVWGVHKGAGYLASVVALFASNYLANSISIWATGRRVKREQAAAGQQRIDLFSQNGWQSPVLNQAQVLPTLAINTPQYRSS